MAGLEHLTSVIYHEKQQQGSMLCAQHALNSLLQGHYFTAPDLSDIANNLDVLEGTFDEERGEASTNMDDTGFFSVQVLENALKVWGLNLVRWRSEEMRPHHDAPHAQLGFILNLEQHWFTLRRFGPAEGNCHWYNLNSFLPAPEWVGKLYLSMVLQQSEQEGYSVFAVTPTDPGAPLGMPRVLADEIAATLPEPSSVSIPSTRPTAYRTMPSSATPPAQDPSIDPEFRADNYDEEDYELQAILHESLMAQNALRGEDGGVTGLTPPPIHRQTIPLPDAPGPSISNFGAPIPGGWPAHFAEHEATDVDPVAQSIERNRRLLEQMQAQQAQAMSEREWTDDNLAPEEAEALRERRERRRREEEEEEEQLRRVMEESEKMHREHRAKRARLSDDDEDMESDSDQPAALPQTSHIVAPSSHASGSRVYDDEDADLQAALKLSLESVPAGWQEPAFSVDTPQPPAAASIPAKDMEASVSVTSTTSTVDDVADPEPVPEPIDLDEIRRRRLARFGA
ncbi:Josephin-domain-containing protein [Coprinopsis marcescibilis]|uniref:ubiquitinyl hydrolase 1 n=1 Tax=Coprinopsis marcescibilis TaxID=230819 RepID=A0A5C3KNA3_COPMA|nr:Josephin-domain-containing protein [Coprinopsis marcescibilis]